MVSHDFFLMHLLFDSDFRFCVFMLFLRIVETGSAGYDRPIAVHIDGTIWLPIKQCMFVWPFCGDPYLDFASQPFENRIS